MAVGSNPTRYIYIYQCYQQLSGELQKNEVLLIASLWRGTEVLKVVLKAELGFHRYVHFARAPIYIFGPHHKQCASD